MKKKLKINKRKIAATQESNLYATKLELKHEATARFKNDEIIMNNVYSFDAENKDNLEKVKAEWKTKQENNDLSYATKDELKIQTNLQNLKFEQVEDDLKNIQKHYFKKIEAEKIIAEKQDCVEHKLITTSNIIYEAINEVKTTTDIHTSNINKNETDINQTINEINYIKDNYLQAVDLDKLLSNKQNINDTTLQTRNKTIVGAINEININKTNIEDFTSFQRIVLQYQNVINNSLNSKQNKNDTALITNNKNVINAINELKLSISNWNIVGKRLNARIWSYDLIINKNYRVAYNWTANDNRSKIYKEFTWTGNPISIETYIDAFSEIAMSNITALGTINIIEIKAINTGINIVNKIGTSFNGRIISLEELA